MEKGKFRKSVGGGIFAQCGRKRQKVLGIGRNNEENVMDERGKRGQRAQAGSGKENGFAGIFVLFFAVINPEQERAQHICRQYAEGKRVFPEPKDKLGTKQSAKTCTQKNAQQNKNGFFHRKTNTPKHPKANSKIPKHRLSVMLRKAWKNPFSTKSIYESWEKVEKVLNAPKKA